MPSPKALHSKNTPKWGTPEAMIELARELLGYIHLDPASSEEFNCLVKALMIYREQDNGLSPECIWAGNVFCNPPGGLVNAFWNKLCESFFSGNVEKAFWVGFSVEQLCTLVKETYHPMDFSTCILKKRLSFNQQIDTPILGPWVEGSGRPSVVIEVTNNVGNKVQELRDIIGYEPPKIVKGDSPSHGNYVTALGCDPDEFERLFAPLGKCFHGRFSQVKPI